MLTFLTLVNTFLHNYGKLGEKFLWLRLLLNWLWMKHHPAKTTSDFHFFYSLEYYDHYYLLTILIWFCRSGSVYWKELLLANSPHALRVWIGNCIINILPNLLLFRTLYGTGSALSLPVSVFLTSMPFCPQ